MNILEKIDIRLNEVKKDQAVMKAAWGVDDAWKTFVEESIINAPDGMEKFIVNKLDSIEKKVVRKLKNEMSIITSKISYYYAKERVDKKKGK